MDKKICTKCEQEKSLDDFRRKKNGALGREAICKLCRKEDWADYYRRNRGKRLKHSKDDREYQQRYRAENKDRVEASRKRWRDNNPEKIKEYQQRAHKKESSDPLLRMLKSLRTRMAELLRHAGEPKKSRCLDLIGCTLDELKLHLESQFVDGMTWCNYGSVWHVDHIRPLSSYTKDELVNGGGWHKENLQPLLREENLRKGSHYQGKRHSYS